MPSTTIAELLQAGVVLRPSEAVAVTQKLVNDPHDAPQPPFGPPSIHNISIDDDGSVTCRGGAVKPAVSEIGILLETMLPQGTRVPGGLRYTIARALMNVDAPPFDSLEDLSLALSHFERHERDAVVRDLLDRVRAMAEGGSPAAILPFKPSTPVRVRSERRHPAPAALVAELRRELRRADLERYARQKATTFPDLRRALGRQKRPIGAVMAGLGGGVLLIVSGNMMRFDPPAPGQTLPAVESPEARLPEPAAARFPPPHVSWLMEPAARNDATTDVPPPRPAFRRASPSRIEGGKAGTLTPAARPVRNERVEIRPKRRAVPAAHPDGRERRARPGMLSWLRGLFTYRHDL